MAEILSRLYLEESVLAKDSKTIRSSPSHILKRVNCIVGCTIAKTEHLLKAFACERLYN